MCSGDCKSPVLGHWRFDSSPAHQQFLLQVIGGISPMVNRPDDSATHVTGNEEAVVDMNVQDSLDVEVPVSDPSDLAENTNKETAALRQAQKESNDPDKKADLDTVQDTNDAQLDVS